MRRSCAIALAVLAVPAAAPAAEPADCAGIGFVEVAAARGVEFRHERGAVGEKHLPETMGAGVAWLDFDGDGWQDLYLVQSGRFPPTGGAAGDRLYRNLGGGRFEDVTGRAGAGARGYGQGVVAADLEGDGDADLLVTAFGGLTLLRNTGAGAFEDVTAASGLDAGGWLSSAALADGDGDGDLDLYLTRYLEFDPGSGLFCGDPDTGERRYCDPSLFLGAGDLYFRNRGGARFEEVTEAAGLSLADGRGLGVVFTDLDGDGLADLYVANDLTLNLFLRNRGDGTFEDLSLVSGTAVNGDGKPEAGMGIAVADVDGDTDPDLAVTNFDVETNTLYENLAPGLFRDISAVSGFGPPSFNRLAFGVVAADFDRDGAVDFYLGNGHIFERPRRDNTAYRQPDQLLLGDGRGRFHQPGCVALTAAPEVTRGVAAADYDNDGDPDLAVQSNGGPFRLFDNGVGRGRWLGVVPRGGGANREAIGARVELTGGPAPQVRWVMAGDSYQSSSDRRPLFGWGAGNPGAVEIVWPSGARWRLLGPPPDRYLVVPEASARRSASG